MDESPFQSILCSNCRKSYNKSTSFWLSSCSHIICSTCYSIPSPPLPDPELCSHQCPISTCKKVGAILKLREELSHGPEKGIGFYFRPVSGLLDELGMAVNFQMGNLKEQIEFLTNKVGKQRQVLDKIQSELIKAKEITIQANKVPILENEIQDLKLQLLSEKQARQEDRNFYHQDQLHQATRKRLPSSPPIQPEPIRRAPSNSGLSSRQNLNSHAPLQPNRLTFSPSDMKEHESRLYQNNLERSQSARPFGYNSSNRANSDSGSSGRGRRHGSVGVAGSLSNFAFDPHRGRERERERARPFTSPPNYDNNQFTNSAFHSQNPPTPTFEYQSIPSTSHYPFQPSNPSFLPQGQGQAQHDQLNPSSSNHFFPTTSNRTRTPFQPPPLIGSRSVPRLNGGGGVTPNRFQERERNGFSSIRKMNSNFGERREEGRERFG